MFYCDVKHLDIFWGSPVMFVVTCFWFTQKWELSFTQYDIIYIYIIYIADIYLYIYIYTYIYIYIADITFRQETF